MLLVTTVSNMHVQNTCKASVNNLLLASIILLLINVFFKTVQFRLNSS